MPRGGCRAGAGRPPNISLEDAEFIRRDYEQRAIKARREQWEASTARELAKRGGVVWEEGKKPNPADLYGVLIRLQEQGKPLPFTKQEVGKYQEEVSKYGLLKSERKIPEALPEVVRRAIEVVRDNKKKRTRRHQFTETLPKLAGGQRLKIIAAVAKDWGVSTRTVRTIIETKPAV